MNNVDEKVDKLAEVKQPIPPLQVQVQPSKKKNNFFKFIAIAVIIIGVIYIFEDEIGSLIPREETEVIDADIQLYQFNDLVSNETVNVELWIMNIGEETASDIEIYIRVRNQNGTILYSKVISITALLLRENETCSGVYTVLYGDAEYLTHTVEIFWNNGRKAYSKKTILI